MPTFNFSGGSTSGGFDMSMWNVSFFMTMMIEGQGFINGPPHTQLAFFLGNDELWFNGTFTNLDASNVPQSGTVNSIDYSTTWFGAESSMSITGLALPVATMLNYLNTDNVAALHAALFDGADTMHGGAFSEFLIGYGGTDTMNGNGGNDDLVGGLGNDTLNGGDGNDTLDMFGLGEGNDILNGGAGDDTITANGVDTIDGGDGVDSAYVDLFSSNVGSTMTLSTLLSASGYTFANGTSIRNIEWLQLVSGSGADTLTFDTNGGLTYWNGGLGTDTLIADRSSTNVAIFFTAGVIGQAFDRFEGVNFEGVEQYHINGSTVGDQLTGREGADIFNGGGGDDFLNGMGGADQLNGGDGNDTIFATMGADTVTAGDGNDLIYTTMGAGNVDGGAGTDTLNIDASGSSSANSLNWNALGSGGAVLGVTQSGIEAYSITLGSGSDTVTITGALTANGALAAGSGTDTITANFAGVSARMYFSSGQNLTVGAFTLTLTEFENGAFTGGEDDDLFQGGASGNWSFNGGGGADTMESQDGNDTLNGGAGDDVIRLLSLTGTDSLNGGDGIDTFEGRLVGHNTGITLNSATLTAGITLSDGTTITNFERLGWANLTAFNDTLDLRGGYATGTYYHGEGGTDLLIADYSAGATVQMNYANDAGTLNGISLTSFERLQITGSSDNDQLMGGSGADILSGGGGNDLMLGQGGADSFDGGDGDDTMIVSGAGSTIEGGNGTDTLTISRFGSFTPTTFNISGLTSGWNTLFDGTMVRNVERISFHGSGGNDTFNLSLDLTGILVLHGDTGDDRLLGNFTATNQSVEVNVNNESLRIGLQQIGIASFEQIEITGGSAQDYLSGGNWSNDIFRGGAGNDELWGRGGVNQLYGEDGDDTLISSGVDIVDGGVGDDVVNISRDFSAPAFTNVGMSTATGVTLSDGTVIRNVERFQYNGGFGGDTVNIYGAILTGLNSIAPGFGFGLDQATIDFRDNLHAITVVGAFTDTASSFTLGVAGGWDVMTIYGSAHADTLWGFSDDIDNLYGGGGNDILRGFLGNDLIDGGSGVDTAVYGSSTTTSWHRNADGTWTVIGDFFDGHDIVRGVEILDFTDRDVYLTRVERTFNGDRTSDILFRSDAGTVASWNVNGVSLTTATFLGNASASEWSVLGTGDFNGDGRDDVIWQHSSTLIYGWRMNDGAIDAGIAFAGVGNEWNFLGAGDFNWDGVDDFAWQHVSGVVFTWEMGASGISSAGYVTGLGLEWDLQGFGDFNGDGRDDFLWRNANTGQSYVWMMNGRAITASGPTSSQVGNDWTIVGIGDFNVDGRDDILWQSPTGQIASWQMNGGQVTGASFYGSVNPAQWEVTNLGDYNGDGRDDVLFTGNGVVYVWLLGEGVIASSGIIAGIGGEWDVIGD